MAKEITSTTSNKRPRASVDGHVQQTLPFIVAEFNGRKVTIKRSRDYQESIAAIRRAFKTLCNDPLLISARFEELDDTVEITEELWSELAPKLTRVQVRVDNTVQDHQCACGCVKIFVATGGGRSTPLYVSLHQQIDVLHAKIHDALGIPRETYRLYEASQGRLKDDETFASYEIQAGDTIDLLVEQIGKKPVIYLFPTTPLPNVEARLSLTRGWKFSALYPPTPIQTGDSPIGETVSWTVDASPDGTLLDHATRRQVAYLFWEAHTRPGLPLSPACSRPSTPTAQPPALAFDPSRPIIEPNNSVLLPFSKLTDYIDDALLALGLHTEARTSFITYWLPDLLKHKFVALRFLPQAEYEAAAPLTVTPPPEVTTRVFMLFRGVEEGRLAQWERAHTRAREDACMWQDIVGINLQNATNQSLFRVLEWGGMEVK